jgi:hypothetical protein
MIAKTPNPPYYAVIFTSVRIEREYERIERSGGTAVVSQPNIVY